MSPLMRADGAVKPNVVAFLATMLLVAGVATVVDPPGTQDEAITIAIDGDVAAGATSPSTGGEPARVDDQATSTEPGTTADGEDATPTADVAADDQASTPAGAGTTGGDTGPAATPGSTGPAPAAGSGEPASPGSAATPTAYPEAPLYDGEEKFRGITDDQIVMCGHAALVAAAAFNTSEDDINVYWEMVNEQGGIYGREVEFTWEDDKYLSSEAITAAETCAGKDPFLILGGIGFDQIPGVRNWAEDNRELYIHHIAVAPTQTYNYSYSLQPTVQGIGHEFGLMLAEHYADRTIGILYRDSENWRPGYEAGRAVLEERGVEIAAEHGVVQNQGVYTQEINDMMLKGVDVVWLWENALNDGAIINQAGEQGFKPRWVLFPFQTTLDLLRDRDQDIIGGATWPAYRVGGYGDEWSEYGLPSEIAAFEAAYAEYRPGVTPNDLLFQVWLGFKTFHRMLLDCGPDCNRNNFAGMMLSGYEAQVRPLCPFWFTGPKSFGGHHGVSQFFEQEIVVDGDDAWFRTSRYCSPTLG